MEDIFFTILQKASDKGLFNSVNVSEEIKQAFIADGIHNSKPSNWWQLPYDLIHPLKELGYIHYIRFIPENGDQVPDDWMDKIILTVSITPAGQEYFLRNKITRMQIEISELTLKKMKGFEFKVWMSIVIAAISAVFTGYPFFKNNSSTQLEKQKSHVTNKPQSQQRQDSTKGNPKASLGK